MTVKILFKTLRKRGYSRSFLRQCIQMFRMQSRKQRHDKIIPLIMKYSSISKMLNYKFRTSYEDFSVRHNLLPGVDLVSAYRRNKNLCDFLVQAKLPELTGSAPPKLDPQFFRPQFVTNAQDGKIIRRGQGFSPGSTNCIYLICCDKCGMKYVGETGNKLSVRMSQHRYHIVHRKDTETLLVQHFLLHGVQSLKFTGLQWNSGWSRWDRRKRERLWIFHLGTMEPHGLNMRMG